MSAATLNDIARNPVVPGANDNLSGVAALVALAEAFRERPVAGLRVMLASCGAEEVLQGGIYGFARRHLAPLDRDRTWLINLDTVGSPELAMLEGEGAFVMEDYFDRGLRDLCERVAIRDGIAMRRGMRASTSTDSVIPSRMGIPTVCLTSLNRHKALSNYHSPADVPENLSYRDGRRRRRPHRGGRPRAGRTRGLERDRRRRDLALAVGLQHAEGDPEVLDREPGGVEQGDLVVGRAGPGARPAAPRRSR